MNTNFRDRRIAFIFNGSEVCYQDPSDHRAAKVWVSERLGFTFGEWAGAIRGYLMPGRINFFTGAAYDFAPKVDDSMVATVLIGYQEHCGSTPLEGVYNGCIVSEEGDVWPPLYKWDFAKAVWERV